MDEMNLEEIKSEISKLKAELNSYKVDFHNFSLNSTKIVNEGLHKGKDLKKHLLIIDSLNQTTNEIIEVFKAEKTRISTLLKQTESFYENKYIPLLNKINDKSTGLSVNLSNSKKHNQEIEKLKIESTRQLETIKASIELFSKKFKEFNQIDSKIGRLFQSASDHKLKIDDFLNQIIEKNKEISLLWQNIKKLNSESQSSFKSIQDSEVKSKKLLQKIEDNQNISDERLIEIQNIYNIAHETGLSGEFEKRSLSLKDDIKKWEKRLFISSSTLLGGLITLFIFQLWLYNWEIKNHTFDGNFYFRFLILSPIVYYLTFCSIQFNKSKVLFDKYSFKTTLSMSIKHHIELLTLNEKFQEKERIDIILKFIIEAFNKIYNEPYSNEDYQMKVKLANIELDMQKRIADKFSTIKLDHN